jgi:hypothetical protein
MDSIQPIKITQERKSNLLKEIYTTLSPFPTKIKYEHEELLPDFEEGVSLTPSKNAPTRK